MLVFQYLLIQSMTATNDLLLFNVECQHVTIPSKLSQDQFQDHCPQFVVSAPYVALQGG